MQWRFYFTISFLSNTEGRTPGFGFQTPQFIFYWIFFTRCLTLILYQIIFLRRFLVWRMKAITKNCKYVYMCVCVHMSESVLRGQRRRSKSLKLESSVVVSHWTWCWEVNLSPLQEEPSLQPLFFAFKLQWWSSLFHDVWEIILKPDSVIGAYWFLNIWLFVESSLLAALFLQRFPWKLPSEATQLSWLRLLCLLYGFLVYHSWIISQVDSYECVHTAN